MTGFEQNAMSCFAHKFANVLSVRPFIYLRQFGGFLILTGFEQNAMSCFAEQVYSLFLCMQIYLHVLIFIVVF